MVKIHDYTPKFKENLVDTVSPTAIRIDDKREKQSLFKSILHRLCSIGVLMPVLLVTQIVVTALVVWALGFFNTLSSIADLTVQLEHEIASRINDTNIHTLQLPSKSITEVRLDALGTLFWEPENMRFSLWNHFATFSELSLLYIGLEDETYIAFEKLDNGSMIEWDRPAGLEAEAVIYRVDPRTGARYADWGPVAEMPFDTTERPWYSGAMKHHPEMYWTDVYEFSPGLLGITLAGTVRYANGTTAGVAAMDYTLTALSNILTSVRLTENGIAFIAKKSGELLASNIKPPELESDDEDGDDGDDDDDFMNDSIELAVNSTVPTIAFVSSRSAYADGSFHHVVSPQMPRNIMTMSKGLERYYVIACDFPFHKTIDWIIFVIIPESDIMSNVYATTGIVAGITLGVILLSVLSAILFTLAITWPLRRLQLHMAKVSSLKLSQPSPRIWNLYEIRRIENSFKSMISALRSFRKFVPDSIIRASMQGSAEVDVKLESCFITVFFLDIADFTTMAEVMQPDELVVVIGEAMELLTDAVVNHGATIDKYIGDCIMALWNVPNPVENHQVKACLAALECQKRLKSMHEGWRRRGLPELEARVGIHCGQALVGNFGSSTRLNFTAIGDNVNLAARLEPLNKLYRTKILISDEMYEAVRDQVICRFVDRCMVKGRSQPTCIYEVVADTRRPSLLQSDDSCEMQEITMTSAQLNAHVAAQELMGKVADLWLENDMTRAIMKIEEAMLLQGYENNYSMAMLKDRFEKFASDPQQYVQAIPY